MSQVPRIGTMKPLRDVRQEEGRGDLRDRYQPRPCAAPGCELGTKDRKPYCLEHVALNPYAASLGPDAPRKALESVCASQRRRDLCVCGCRRVPGVGRKLYATDKCKRRVWKKRRQA